MSPPTATPTPNPSPQGGGENTESAALVRANRSGFHPRLDQRARFLLGAGSRSPAVSGRPSPTDEMVLADMLNERVDGSVSVRIDSALPQSLASPADLTP